MANWMSDAVTPRRRGTFKRKANAAGMSTAAYAQREQTAPGRLGKEARLAQTFARFRPKRMQTMTHRITELRRGGAFGA